jgi:hypothetical protein
MNQAAQTVQNMQKQQVGSKIGDLANKAEKLAGQQQDFEQQMRKNFGVADADEKTAAQMANQRAAMREEYSQIQKDLQQATRAVTGSQPDVAKQLRDAAGRAQQNEIEQRMQLSENYLRQGMGQFAVMREAPVTQGLNQLRDDLKNAQQAAAAAGNKGGDQGRQQAQDGIDRVESLRQQMQALARGQQARTGGKPGDQPGGQQPSQQPGGQQPGGQQPGGQQPGGQQPGGQQPGGQQTGNAQGGGGSPQGGGGYVGGNGLQEGVMPQVAAQAQAQGVYNQILRQLGQLRNDMAGDPQLTREYRDLVDRTQGLDPGKWATQDAELAQRIASQALTELDQIELLLRRKAQATDGSVRSATPGTVAPGYSNAWGDYTKKLSK